MALIRWQGYVSRGGSHALSGLIGAGAALLATTYPGATVTVFDAGTTNLSSIFSDSAGLNVLQNPFAADDFAYAFFYAAAAAYTIQFSGSAPLMTLPDVTLGGSGSSSVTTTKGDLSSFSSIPARLPAGPDGSRLVADSTQSTGLAWITAPYILAKAPSGGDDKAYIQGLINTNFPLGIDVRLRAAVYLIASELTTPSGTGAGRLIGTPPQGRNATGTVLRATTLGMRSVMAPAGDSHFVYGIAFDANFKATNDVFLNTTNWMTWSACSFLNAVKHGVTNNAATGNQGHHFYDCYFGNNGALYVSAGLAGSFSSGTRTPIAGTATTAIGNPLVTFAGLAVDLTTIAQKDDVLVVGNALAAAQIMLISSVTSTTITVQGNVFNLPTVAAAGQAFAIGSGDGVHESVGGAVGVNVYDNCRASGSGGCGFRFGGLYGSRILGGQADFNNLFAVSIGRADNVTGAVLAPRIEGLYMEANFGTANFNYFFGGSTGLTVTPAPSGVGSMTIAGALLATGTIDYSSGPESIQNGLPQNALIELRNTGGILEHRIVAEFWDGFDPLEFDRVVGHSVVWTPTPTLDATHGFATGIGIYDIGGKFGVALNVAKAQNPALNDVIVVEVNSTGVDYDAQMTTDSINVAATTIVRPGIYLRTTAGVLTSIDTTTIVAGKSIGFRVNVKIR